MNIFSKTSGTFLLLAASLAACSTVHENQHLISLPMQERQITFTPKNHVLDNNDNFSPDGRFLCYDTRGTVYNEDIGNSKTIEKVEIATGEETVLWDPPSITGERAAPGVGAVSYHPYKDEVIFIHGPDTAEVRERGYYAKPNRTAVAVAADGSRRHHRVDRRDVTHDPTPAGAHRGGTHRHEYCRDGSRIGFTYDDYLVRDIDRTIGFMQPGRQVPAGYTHYFAVILTPAEKGKALPGEIEKAYGDSWVDSAGTRRAFIGKVRQEKGNGYDYDLFVAGIPKDLDITTAFAGTKEEYPRPPEGIVIRRLTRGMHVGGIVRGSYDGTRIAFAAQDPAGTGQLFIIRADGSEETPRQVTRLPKPVEALRWHPSGEWVLFLSDGDVMAAYVGEEHPFGTLVKLSEGKKARQQLVLSPDGTLAAYDIATPTENDRGEIVKDATGHNFRQIWIMQIDWRKVDDAMMR